MVPQLKPFAHKPCLPHTISGYPLWGVLLLPNVLQETEIKLKTIKNKEGGIG